MELELIQKIKNDKKMYDLLKLNSYWIKDLNRDPNNYKRFVSEMKTKYRLRATDKISDAIDNIDLITGILDTLK